MGPVTAAAPVVEDVAWFEVGEMSAAGSVRRLAMRVAGQLGYGEVRTAEVGIVASELASNLALHGAEGSMLVRISRCQGVAAIEVVSIDRGPGLADIGAAMEDGRSDGGTLGVGLGAVARLADSWDGHSVVGRGTVLVATMGPEQVVRQMSPMGMASPGGAAGRAAGLTRAIPGEEECGDGYAVRTDVGVTRLLMCDGLGHGPLAATATRQIVHSFLAQSPASPSAMLARLHRDAAGTRGAAAAVAQLDPAAGSLVYAGLGNVFGALVVAGQRRILVSKPGIVGHQARQLGDFTHELPPGALVVMHSDGLRDHWNLDDHPGIVRHDPLVVAATLWRDAGGRRDDSGIVVARAA